MDVIEFSPTDGLSYNPNEEIYWNKSALRKEIERTFELCHSCRMCFKYCDAFPVLFDIIDQQKKSVSQFTNEDIDTIAEKCFQCKVCYFKCPYTKTDKHEFNLDFPRLMMRLQAIRAKEKGIAFTDKLLGNPDLIGKLGCATAPLSNWGNKNPLGRKVMETVIGIHHEKKLPSFSRQTFFSWFKKNKGKYAIAADKQVDKVVLFHTCFGNYNNPELAKETVFVLWKNGVQVEVPKLNCCGMPAMESGNLDFARQEALQNVKTLMQYVQQGYKVLALNPTCSLTMKEEYPILLQGLFSAEELELASKAVYDVCEYLFTLKRDDKLNREFKSTPGKIAYHIPCHYRAQNIGYRSRDVMKTIAGTSFILVDECCGHNGTWAMKKDNFKDSMRIGARAFDRITAEEHDLIASDCPLAAIQIGQALGDKVLHPVQVLARAYREDGFARKLESNS